jgi:hypothetical protein
VVEEKLPEWVTTNEYGRSADDGDDSEESPHGCYTLYCSTCGFTRTNPRHCTDKFCEPCQKHRTRVLQARALSVLPKFVEGPNVYWWHVTITTVNYKDLYSGTRELVKAFKEVRRTREWKCRVYGGFYGVETTWNEVRQDWHVHIHALVLGKDSLLHFSYQKELAYQLGGRGSNFKCDRIEGYRHRDAVLCHLIGYSQKTSGISKKTGKERIPEHKHDEYNRAFRKLRRFNTFGSVTKIWSKLSSCKPICICPQCQGTNWLTEFAVRRLNRRAELLKKAG